MANLKLEILMCLACFVLLWTGCGEKENKHLVNARVQIQRGEYKNTQEIAALKDELDMALKEETGNPEALCPLKALEIVGPGADAATREKAVADIISHVRSIEDEIKELEAIDEDLLTDDDKEELEKLNRKWDLSLEPAVVILKSETGWISDVGRPAIDLLIEALKVSNPMVQSDIVELLISLRDQSFEALIESLQNESSMVRRQAVIALGRIGDESAVEPITSLLDDEDPGVRFYIPVALEMIGGEKILDSLHKALKNEVAQVRVAAANILGSVEDETGMDLLVEMLADDNSHVKTSATNALMRIGKPVVPELIEILETQAENISLPSSDFVGDKIGDEYKKVLAKRAALQVSAASILGNLNDTRAIEPLLEAMRREAGAEATEEEQSHAESVRSGAAAALEAIGPAAVEPLVRVLESQAFGKGLSEGGNAGASAGENEEARVNAASILGNIGDKRAVVPLLNALKDENKNVRASAAESLGKLKDRRATLPLIETLMDVGKGSEAELVVARTNAAAALGTMADKTATQPLIEAIMDKNEREKIRTAAIDSLGTIKDVKAQETLVKVLIDEYEKDGTRKSAAAALRKMEKPWASEALIGLLEGEIVSGVFAEGEFESSPTSAKPRGVITTWLKKEGDENLIKDWTPLAEISFGDRKTEVKAPDSGKLVKIYIQEGEEVEAGALMGLVSFEDKEIEEEERSSIRSAAALALGKVKGDNALPALMRSVREDKSAAVRKNAAQSLWELDKADGRPVLIKVLKGDDSGIVRSESALGLGKGNLKGKDCVPPLIHTLRKDKYESARVKAAWSLGEIADRRAIEPLIDAIVEGRKGEEEASAVITEVISALDKIAGPAVDPLVAVLRDKDIDEVPRSKAARILGLIENVRATEPLIAALKDESVVVRSEAAKSLGLVCDRRAVEPLIDALTDENEWVTVRANAAESLGKLEDERAVVPLINSLESGIAAIRSNAVVALGTLKDKRATMPLMRILEDETEDDAIRVNAISSLGSIVDPRAIDALIAALDSSIITIRQEAAAALAEYEAGVAVEPLMAIVSDMNEPFALRADAAEALGNIGDERAASLLRERLGDSNESNTVWNNVARAAGKLRVTQVPKWVSTRAYDTWEPDAVRFAAFMALAASAEDLSAMLEMLGDATKEIRAGAAIVLGETGRKEAVQPLIDKMLSDGEEIVRRDSAKGLAALADPDSEQALIKAHKEDATESVRVQAAIALGNIKGKEGVAALASTLQDATVAKNIRLNAAKALGEAGRDEAIPALRSALEDNLGSIHFEAAEALRKITGESFGYER